MVNVLVIDDNPIVQSVLKFLIEENFNDCNAVVANDIDSSIEKIKKNGYDLILLAANMQDCKAIDQLPDLIAFQPGLKILIFNMTDKKAAAKMFLQIGVMGFLAKDEQEAEIKIAIENVLNNKKYISPKLTQIIADDLPGNNHNIQSIPILERI